MVQPTPAPAKKSKGPATIIIVIVVIVLLCCCAVIIGGALWGCGDLITGAADSCSFF